MGPREQILQAMGGGGQAAMPNAPMPPPEQGPEQGMPVDQAIQFLMSKNITEQELPVLKAAVEALEMAGIIPSDDMAGAAPMGQEMPPQGAVA